MKAASQLPEADATKEVRMSDIARQVGDQPPSGIAVSARKVDFVNLPMKRIRFSLKKVPTQVRIGIWRIS